MTHAWSAAVEQRVRMIEAIRKNRRVGAIYRAWCAGYAAAWARRPKYPDRAGDFVGSVAVFWLRGYRHRLRQRPRMEQTELFQGGES